MLLMLSCIFSYLCRYLVTHEEDIGRITIHCTWYEEYKYRSRDERLKCKDVNSKIMDKIVILKKNYAYLIFNILSPAVLFLSICL